MVRIQSITEVRQKLPQLVKKVEAPIVIVQNSKPAAVLVSYADFLEWEKDKEEKVYLAMVRKSPSYSEDDNEPQNYHTKDVKPLSV